jgi:hypothetical protein
MLNLYSRGAGLQSVIPSTAAGSRRYSFLIGASIALLTAVRIVAAEPEHSHHGAMNPAQSELGADAAFDRDGVLWAVHKVSGHIAVNRSVDFGQSWSNPVLVTPAPEPTDAGGDARPKIALGPKGEIYVTWTKPLGKPYTGEVKFSRSLDGGRTFSPPTIVHHDRQEITHRFDALAVNSTGQIFVAWIDKRDAVAAAATSPGAAYRGAAIYFAVSDDRGANFRGDFKAAAHTCECCRIALTATPDGTMCAMWRNVFEPNVRDHAIATLRSDGSVATLRRATFENWCLDACPHHGPSVAEDAAGHLHAVWFSGAPQHEGVFYGRVDAGADRSSRHIGGSAAEHADIAAAGQRVAIVWKEFDGSHTRLRSMISEDSGVTWKESDLAQTEEASDHPHVLSFNRQFYVLWNTRSAPLQIVALP